MSKNTHLLKTQRWQRLRAQFVAAAPLEGYECAICGDIISPLAQPKSPESLVLDHKVPLNCGGDVYNLDNIQPAHLRCNSSRGSNYSKPTGSRIW